VFVATRPMTRPHGWASTLLHGGTALSLQRRLHGHDAPLIVLPMRVELGARGGGAIPGRKAAEAEGAAG
jgi:hypothetical protein